MLVHVFIFDVLKVYGLVCGRGGWGSVKVNRRVVVKEMVVGLVHHRQDATRILSGREPLIRPLILLVVFKGDILVVLRFIGVRRVIYEVHLISIRDINFTHIELVSRHRLRDYRLAPILRTLTQKLLVLVDLREPCFKRDLRNVVVRRVHVCVKKLVVWLGMLGNKRRGDPGVFAEPHSLGGVWWVPLRQEDRLGHVFNLVV